MNSAANPETEHGSMLAGAARWFLRSGIQSANGGVARYWMADKEANAGISTEITGYSVSSMLDLYKASGNEALLEGAIRAGNFLCGMWDHDARWMPFEVEDPHSYFFDCGIIVRGLLRLQSATGNPRYREIASLIGESMVRDFYNGTDIDPILALPDRKPVGRDHRWSRQSACYQLKSALGLLQLQADGYEFALDRALRTHAAFPENAPERIGVMDRLHAYCYFMEGLLPVLDRPECRTAMVDGMERAARLLREIRPQFLRSDVCAQFLRVRLFAAREGVAPLNETEASEEATWAAGMQLASRDVRRDGGWLFGVREGSPCPYVNPVSTAFCSQALRMWHDWQANRFHDAWHDLI